MENIDYQTFPVLFGHSSIITYCPAYSSLLQEENRGPSGVPHVHDILNTTISDPRELAMIYY